MERDKEKKHDVCDTVLLEDDPSNEDALGGGHARTARALVDLVQNTSGGKAVALFGSWGSGKSTVIKLFQQEVLKENPDVKVFIYDAWSHEGDPLRRSFLERLAAFLEMSGWIKGGALAVIKNQMDELTGRKEETRSQSSAIATREGKWIGGLLALGLPVGAALLSAQPPYEAPTLIVAAALLSISLPVLAAIGFALEKRSHSKGRVEFPSLISQSITTTKTTTIRTPEPTSIEFADRFGAMMDQALIHNRRLVIVMDNLDRLPDNEARSIWSTMRTFFESNGEKWREKLWLIVPIDPSAIPRLWKSNDEDKNNDHEGHISIGRSADEVFVSKFFQVGFYVPPPVLSEWKTLFLQLLSEAFPRHREEEYYAIYRVYKTFVLRADRPPTPRELKQFVNQIGAQHRIWQDDIPLSAQALFVALRRELLSNPRDVLVNKESDIKRTIPEKKNWKDYLVAQHYNVEPNKALQVLFIEEIRKGLEGGDHTALREISKQLDPEVLGILVIEALAETSDWVENAPENLARSALAIKQIEDLLLPRDYEQAMAHLRAETSRVERWKAWDEDVIEGFIALVSSAREERRRDLVSTVLSRLKQANGDSEVADIENAVVETAREVVSFLNQLKKKLALDPPEDYRFQVPRTTDWIAVLGALQDQELSKEIIKVISPLPSEHASVLNELESRVAQGHFGMKDAQAVRVLSLSEFGRELNWQGLVNNLRTRLSNTSVQYPDEQLWAMVYALLQIEPTDASARSALEQLAGSWPIFHHLQLVQKDKTQAVMLLLIAFLNPTGYSQSWGGQASHGKNKYYTLLQQYTDELLQEMADVFADLNLRGTAVLSIENLIQAVTKEARTKALLSNLLRKVKKPYQFDIIKPSVLLEYGDELTELLGEDAVAENYRAHQDAIVSEVQDKQFALDLIPVYKRVLDAVEDAPLKEFSGYLIEELKNQTQKFWSECMQAGNECDVCDLLEKLTAQGDAPKLDHKLADAIEAAAMAMLQYQEAEHYDPTAIRGYLEFLDGAARKNLAARLVRKLPERFSEHADKNAEYFLKAVGEEILGADVEKGIWASVLRDLMLTWLPKALERLSQVELHWFARLLEKLHASIPDLREEVRNEALDRVQEVLRRTTSEAKDDVVQDLQKIASIIQSTNKRK